MAKLVAGVRRCQKAIFDFWFSIFDFWFSILFTKLITIIIVIIIVSQLFHWLYRILDLINITPLFSPLLSSPLFRSIDQHYNSSTSVEIQTQSPLSQNHYHHHHNKIAHSFISIWISGMKFFFDKLSKNRQLKNSPKENCVQLVGKLSFEAFLAKTF